MVATLVVGAAVAEMLHWLQKLTMKRSKVPDLLPHPADHARLTKTISEVKTLLSDIEIGPHIGAGTFGKVYKGQPRIARNVAVPCHTAGSFSCGGTCAVHGVQAGVYNWETPDRNTTNPGNTCMNSFFTKYC